MSVSCEDGEPVVVENRCIRRARKQHECCACDRVIHPGELYAYNFLVWDGNGHTYRRCGSCETTWQHLLKLCNAHNDAEDKAVYAWRAATRAYQSGATIVHPGPCPYQNYRFPDEELNCGLEYDDEWDSDPPDEIASLPFISNAEASALLEARR